MSTAPTGPLREQIARLLDAGEKRKAGAFVSLKEDGALLIKRGYPRLTDIAARRKTVPASGSACGDDGSAGEGSISYEPGEPEDAAGPVAQNDATVPSFPIKLLTELTAYHSLGLRNAMASDHRIAHLTVLHALTLKLFYRYTSDSCLQIEARDTLVPPFAGLGDFKAAKEILARHEAFEKLLPKAERKYGTPCLSSTATRKTPCSPIARVSR